MSSTWTAKNRPALILCGFVLLYAAFTAFAWWERMATQPLWMDELFTFYQVDGKSFRELLDSFGSGVNALPYSYFLLIWLLGKCVALTDSVVRLPSAVFAVATAAVLHRWLSRRFGNSVAFAAVVGALFLSADSRWYMAEARPYTLYVVAAALHLVATSSLVGDDRGSGGRWSWNAVAAGVLPSIHYTGLVYSGALLGAALLSIPRSRAGWIRVVGSFAAGWLVFGLIHFRQVFQILSTGGARWISRPSLAEAFGLLLSQVTLPGLVAWLCLAGLQLRKLAAAPTRAGEPALAVARATPEDRLFCWAAAAWLVTPAALFLMAAAGLPNMALQRYFQPSHLAAAMASALVLHPFLNGVGFWPPRDSSCGARRGRLVPPVVGGIVGACVMQWMLAGWGTVANSRVTGDDLVRIKYAPIHESTIPSVTNDWEAFFEYTYHSHGQGNLSLLVNSNEEVVMWKKFNRNLTVMTPVGMSMLEDYWFFPWPVPYLMFDIVAWCRANSCAVVDQKPFKKGFGYHVVKRT